MRRNVIVSSNQSKSPVAVFTTAQDVLSIVNNLYFKITLDDGKFFIFDFQRYSYEVIENG